MYKSLGKKITFFVHNSITCLNSFEVRAILEHKVIKLILWLFYCLAHKDFPERQFIEKVVHQLTLWMLVLQCRKPVYLFISDSLDSISWSIVRQQQAADSQTPGPDHVLAENPAHTMGKTETRLNPTFMVSDEIVKCTFLVKASPRITSLKTLL